MRSRSRVPAGADTRQILDALRRIVRTLRTPDSARGDLSVARFFVLQTLADAGTLSVNELAARTHTHQSSVSVVVTRLVEMRLVRRVRSSSDARRAELSLTAKGAARLRDAPRAPQERIVAAIRSLSPEVRSRLSESLGELVKAMRIDVEAPAMFFEDEPRSRAARRARRARS